MTGVMTWIVDRGDGVVVDKPQAMKKVLKGFFCTIAVIGTTAYLSPLIFQASYFNFCVMTTSGIQEKEAWSQLTMKQQGAMTAEAVAICNGAS